MKFMTKAQRVLASKAGEGYVDTIVKVIIAVVIGALILVALYAIAKNGTTKASSTADSLFAYSVA